MIYLDIETVPNPYVLETRQWAEYKTKKGLTDDDAALHPAFGRVVCVAMANDNEDPWSICHVDEREIMIGVSKRLFRKKDRTLCGHNIKGFDIPFVSARMIANQIKVPTMMMVAGKKPWEIPHVDTMELLRFGGGQAMSLDAACLMLGIASSKEVPLCASGVRAAFDNRKFDDIAAYCCDDVRATRELYGRLYIGLDPLE